MILKKSWTSFIRAGLCALALCVLVPVSFSGPAAAQEYKLGQLTIVDPWAREMPPGSKVAGGYLTVKNAGTDDRLLAATAEIAGTTEIHEMVVDGNVMRMRKLDNGLPVPANGETVLKPGSYHLMFMMPTRQIKQGDTFKGTLTFEKAGKVAVVFRVGAMGAYPAKNPRH